MDPNVILLCDQNDIRDDVLDVVLSTSTLADRSLRGNVVYENDYISVRNVIYKTIQTDSHCDCLVCYDLRFPLLEFGRGMAVYVRSEPELALFCVDQGAQPS